MCGVRLNTRGRSKARGFIALFWLRPQSSPLPRACSLVTSEPDIGWQRGKGVLNTLAALRVTRAAFASQRAQARCGMKVPVQKTITLSIIHSRTTLSQDEVDTATSTHALLHRWGPEARSATRVFERKTGDGSSVPTCALGANRGRSTVLTCVGRVRTKVAPRDGRRYWTDPPWRSQSHQTLQRLQRLTGVGALSPCARRTRSKQGSEHCPHLCFRSKQGSEHCPHLCSW